MALRYAFAILFVLYLYPGCSATDALQLISRSNAITTTANAASGGDPWQHETSSSARYTVFGSLATNLNLGSTYLPYNTNNVSQIFLYDRFLDTIRPVSYSFGSTSVGGNANSRKPSISDDGCYVAYESQATNLVSVFLSTGTWRIFLTNLCTSTTVLVSVGASTDSFRPRVSDSGNVVVFDSASAGIVAGDTNGASDVFSYNVSTAALTRISYKLSAPTRELQGSSTSATVSADGTKFAFLTTARNAFDSVNGTVDAQVIYAQTGTTNWACVSCGTAGTSPSSGASADPHISSTGAYLVWSTASTIANYTGVKAVNSSVSNIFWLNITAGFANGADNARAYSVKVCDNNATDTLNGNSFWPQVSDNGNLVFFSTDATNVLTDTMAPIPPVVQTDTNGATDVYVHSISAGTTSLVSQRNGASSSGNAQSSYASISRDGAFIVFATNATNLVANDTNSASDVVMVPLVQVQLQSCYCNLTDSTVNCTFNCTSDGICAFNENSGICINATMGDCFNCTINGVCECVESENCTDCSPTPCTPNGICASNENPHNCPADCILCTNSSTCQNLTHSANCTVLACDGCVCRETTPNTTCIALYTGTLQCLNYTICDPTNTTGQADANGCVYVLNNVGTSCNDGFNCTYNDTCNAQGQCQGTSNVTVCNALFPKTCLTKACSPFANGTSDFYDFASGCSYNRTNSSCGDGLSCTSEYCDERVIGNNATTGCNFSFNNTLCNVTFPQTCLSSVCNPFSGSANRIDNVTGCAITRNNATCATGLTCLNRFCDETNGNSSVTTGCYTVLATGGTPCEPDLFTCTDALCDGFGNCQQVNNNTNCPLDGTVCSVETCDPNQIGGEDYNSTTGCYNQNLAPGTPCETDGYICTMDVCSGDTCSHVANNSLCHPFPGTAPFEYASCAFAVCEPGVNGTYVNSTFGCHFHNQATNTSCDDFFNCTYSDVCSGAGFACNGTTNDTFCDPFNQNSVVCIDNTCAPRTPGANTTTGCLATNSTSGPCDDGVPCTVDACNATGICVGTPNNTYCANLPPALGNPCVNSSCNTLLNCIFANVTNGTSCDNDTFTCTQPYCDGNGVCVVFNNNATCATGNPCVQGICDPNLATNLTTGCYFVNLTIPCDDGKSCTYNDTCSGGVCTSIQNDTFCANLSPALGNVCVTGTCTPADGGSDNTTGCLYVNNTNVCDDGFNCTSPDVCSGGVCTSTNNDAFCVAQANALGQCLNATCSPGSMGYNVTTGCLFANLTMGQNCTDGQPCTYNDTCSGAGCTGINNDTYCANLPPALGNVCYTALCNGTDGCLYPFQTTGFPCDNDTFTCTYQLCDGVGNCVTNFNHTFCQVGDQCVTDTCSPGSPGADATTGCLRTNNTDACTDGFSCTYNDTCNGAGVCVGTPNNTFCDSGDTCITGACNITAPGRNNITGCVNATNTNNCTDGYTCTFPDVCSSGLCITTPNNATCFAEAQSYDQCLSAACLPASIGANTTSGCLFFNLTSNETCNDGVFCTLSDGCVNGTCVGTPNDAVCEALPPGFNNSCITGYCNATTDCFYLNETAGTSCTSDVFTCTTEQCDGGGNCITTYDNATCATGTPCITGICDPSNGGRDPVTGCYYVNTTAACDDGKSCTYNDTCSGGVCGGTANNTFCDNLPPGFNNTCVDGTCSPLTMGADNTTGCVFTNNTSPCNDSLSCTFPDVCSDGVCTSTPNDAFCGAEAAILGGCYDAVCNSTDPARNLTTGCVFTPAVGLCTDMYTCTINDICVNVTTCAGTPDNTTCAGLPPALGNLCVGTYCDPPNGQPISGCVFFNQPGGYNCTNDVFTCTTQACDGIGNCITNFNDSACATGDPCIQGECDPSQIGHDNVTGCWYSNTTSPCSDAYTCTVDVCSGGVCVSTPNNTFCSDGNPCHTATCSPGSPGANNITGCLVVNNTNSCNDGVACTLNDTCSGGVCAGTPTNSSCSSGSCFSEYCDATLGCVRTNFTAGTSCTSDNYTCTTEACDGLGTCVTTFNTSLCPPSGNQCIAVTCAPAMMGANATTGCVYANYPNSTACDDGYSCTSNDICDGNSNCVGVPDDNVCAGLSPALGNPCVDGICNITGNSNATGCTFVNHTRPCNDGKNCTNNDACSDGVCAGTADNATCIIIALMSGQCAIGVCQPANISANNITGCVISNLTAGETCDDAVACTFPDVCANGTCTSTPNNSSCDPSNLCVAFHCDPLLGCVYSNKTAGTPCDSDNATCSTQLCDGFGTCITTLNNATCATGNVCTDGICDPSSGSANATTGCRTEFNANLCDDGFTCTSPDICSGGVCVGLINATYCDNQVPALNDDCIDGLCAVNNPNRDNVTGCVFFYPNGTCDDGYPCTSGDMCYADFCIGTDNNITCEALAQLMGQCIGAFCDPFNLNVFPDSGCVFYNETAGEPCDDSIPCTYNDTCSVTGCHGIANDTACAYLTDACGGGVCDLALGCIHPHYPNTTACDDDNFTCTYQLCDGAGSCITFENDTFCAVPGDVCFTYRCDPGGTGFDPITGCVSVFNNATCDDGFNCTINDVCSNGVCTGTPVHSFCDALAPSAGNPCIDGYCNTTASGTDAQGCIFLNNTNPCSDNYTCTDNVCGSGVCQSTNNNATCIVEALTMGVCSSGYCDPLAATNASSGCVIGTLTTGNPCNDNVGCTSNDTCITNTTCQGTTNDTYCDYLDNSCTLGVCNVTGDCQPSYIANNTACNTDAFTCTYQLCNGAGGCITYLNNSVCTQTGDPCVDNLCDPGSIFADPVTGCRLINNNNSCSDGFNCTINDVCTAGVCVGTPLNSFCDALAPSAGNPCIDGYCNITASGTDAQGCIFLNNTNTCTDGYSCTDDVCSGGACVSTINNNTCIVEALLNGTCATGYCFPAGATNVTSGCVIVPLNTTNPCNDNVACTSNDMCVNTTTCAGTTNDTYCHSLFDTPCSLSFCNATTGCFDVPLANNTACNTDAFTCTYQLCAGNGTCVTYFNDSACPASGDVCYDNICDPFSLYANATTGCRLVPNTSPCTDGFNCTINDTCLGGVCLGTPLNSFCDALAPSAGNPCIDGYCNITTNGTDAQGCIFINNTNTCTDGYGCTDDVCSGGVCVSTPDNSSCIVEALNTGICATGYCLPANATNITTGCVVVPLTTGNACNDGVDCTFNDTCVNTTTCAGTGNDTYCHSLFDTSCSLSFCNATTGCFDVPLVNNTSCDTDTFTCTYQLCNGAGGCVTYLNNSACPATGNVCSDNICDPLSVGANATTGCRVVFNTDACDDGFVCTFNDTCSGGTCIGTPFTSYCNSIAPSFNNTCVDGFCDINDPAHDNVTGCVFVNNTNVCSDSYSCTVDVCSGGVCVSTPNNDSCIVEALNTGSCAAGYCLPSNATNATSGCAIVTLTTGNACNDGVACTSNDTCVNTTTCAGSSNDTYCHGLFDTSCSLSFCNATTGCFDIPLANNTACDDDNFTCTYQLCDGAGGCVTYLNNSACPSTGNVCTTSVCDPGSLFADPVTGCRTINTNNSCSDGFNCTVNDVCLNGVCTGAPLNSFCDALAPSAGNPCIDGFCNITANGTDAQGCIFVNDDAAACTDGFQCTTDVCSNGTCVSTQDNAICILYALELGGCGSGICNVSSPLANNVTGCIISNVTIGAPCDDNVACTYNDTCDVSGCTGTTNDTACDFGGSAPCLNPVCDAILGCISVPSPENSTCNLDTYTCTYQLCNATGSCITFYNDSVCVSADPCQVAFCNPAVANASATTGCYYVGLNNVPCDDGIPCTSNDTCVAGVCTGSLNDTYCQGQSPALGNVCINTSCDPLSIFAQPSGCTFSFNNVPCNDSKVCTNNDICFLGTCAGSPNNTYCDNLAPSLGNPCVDGTCSPSTNGSDATTGCLFTNNTSPCNDNITCSNNDVCSGGVCAGTSNNTFCNTLALLLGQCFNATCDRTNTSGRADVNGCVYDRMNSSQPCDDNVTCTQNDVCDGTGACHGTPNNTLCANVSLPSGMISPCAFYVCNANTGCQLSFSLGGTACSDGFSCSVSDVCDGAGHCVGTAVNSFCQSMPPASLNECVNGTCSVNSPNANNVTGCVYSNNSLACNDAIPCTDNDICSNGICSGTPNNATCIMVANTIGDCVMGVCSPESPFYDPNTGCVFDFVQAGQPCDDGQQCTYNDTCMLGGCVGMPNNTACYDEMPFGAEAVCVNPLCISFGVGCIFIPVPSGTLCNDTQPDDGFTCTSARCNSSSMACEQTPTPGFCDVVGDCFVGICDPTNIFANNVTGCAVGVVSSCNDGIPCTADTCVGSSCIGVPVNSYCTSLLPNTTEGCVTAVCNASSPFADLNGCVNTNVTNGLPCDDGITCTDDVCINGTCVGTPNNFTCIGLALGLSGCQTGYCSPGSPNATVSGCVFTGLALGAPCDDMNPCTFNDTCNATCAGTPNTTYCVENMPLGLEQTCVNTSCNALLGCLYAPLPNTTACTDDGFSCTSDFCRAPGFCFHAANTSTCPVGTTCAAYVCNPVIPGADPMTGCAATFTLAGTNCSDIPDDGYSCTTTECNGFGSCVQVADNSLCPPSGGCSISICNTTDPGADPITGCVDIAVGPDPTVLLNISETLQITNTRVQMCAAMAPVCTAGPQDPSSFWNSYVPGMSLPAAPGTVPAIDCIPLFGNYATSCIRNYASEIIVRATRALDCELLLDTIESRGNGTLYTRMCECEALCHLGQPLPAQCTAANPFAQSSCVLGADSATGSPGQIAAVKHISCATLQMILDELNYANDLLSTLIVNCTADDSLSFVRRYPNNTYWATMAFEDTIDLAFDFDYNDFVSLFYIVEAFNNQSNLICVYTEFLPLARGSMYEHQFVFSADGKFDTSPNLLYQMPRPLLYGNYTIEVQRHSTSGAYMGFESSQTTTQNGQDIKVISSTMTALMNPMFNPITSPWEEYFVNTICDNPLKKPEYSYHMFIQSCNDTLNNLSTRPLPGFPIYYFKLHSIMHFDQSPILYDFVAETVYNGMDMLDTTGQPFAFVQATRYDWPCEEYNIGLEYPGFMDLRDWLLDPSTFSPIVITGELWHAFPDPLNTDRIVDSSSVPPF